MKILVIEDDATTREFVSQGLREHGYIVDEAGDGQEGLMMAVSCEYQMIILDRMLPALDGMKVLAAIRATEVNVPVLILSAMDSVEDRVSGLQAGSDDYLTKPFALAELIARTDIIVRRQKPVTQVLSYLEYEGLKLDLKAHRVTFLDNELHLQPKEFQLLQYFMENEEQVISRMRLFEAIWHYHFDPRTNVIDVHIANLRKKLDEVGGTNLLHTVRGAGYVLRC